MPIDADPGGQLLAELDAAPAWPLPREHGARASAMTGRAFRKGDRGWLSGMQGWDPGREYLVDSLPRRIAFGFADFLFAEDLDAKAADGGDQDALDAVIEANRMSARLHRAERIVVSEGEAWWKVHINHAVSGWPILTWNSRLDVVPLLYGDRVLACAFVTERARECGTNDEGEADAAQPDRVWRHAEVHSAGTVRNVLYRGTPDELGRRVGLESRPETAGYNPEWQHGLPMLAGRVVNDFDDDETAGVSEYDAIADLLLALNEAVTIASENARLTGKDRVMAAGRFTRADGAFDASLEVFQVEPDGGTLGEGDGKPPVVVIEKSYDAEPLWLHIRSLVQTCLSRVGLVAQFVGQDVEGAAETGVGIRLRFLPTTNAAKGKAREWKADLPSILHLLLRAAALPVNQGGFGAPDPGEDPPAVELPDPLPRDAGEEIRDVSTAVTSEVMSRRTAIQALHPDWDDGQVDEEVAAIAADIDSVLPPPPPAAA